LVELRSIADLQFRGVGSKLIPDNVLLAISPTTLKIRHLLLNDRIYLSLRAGDHRYILHMDAGYRLNTVLKPPLLRVYVNHKYSEYVAEGGNVFAKHVVSSDPSIKPGDEVLVIDFDTQELIAVGKAVKPGSTIPYHNWGEAVKVRESVLRRSGFG